MEAYITGCIYCLREYYHVLFTNLRVMIESEDVIDQYFGPNGFKYVACNDFADNMFISLV